MRLSVIVSLLLANGLILLNACAGGTHGAGYWFHFIFIMIPLLVIGYLLLKKTDALNDSLNTIEEQMKKMTNRLDNLEERIKRLKNTKKEE
jgi:hypothetical protein